ncbi:Pdc2p [Rhizophagus irregularis DAOM 197198w]|uniref:Pdc2p n=1 Tax=Rhizophagus irregularis (strain DAOM 197198w) TaxID=1432141 RepID=A0A015L7F7_RHIIW|nr:Pdc2p [Rhizophagus irregularis DAOM 197198w]
MHLLQILFIIDTDILREKAKFFAQQFEVNNFAASNGWINGFKERHSLKQYVKWGEAKSAPLETLDEKRKILREIIKDYDLNDVFNCDETGLYWDLEPSKTLAQGPLSGKKNQKNEDLPVNYYWNSTAWMQVLIWNDYLTKLDRQMRLQGRYILLLVDNALVHIIDENTNLTNVTVHFLLPNTTAHLQPCDAGIINSFKAQYQKLLVRNRIKAYEISQELRKETVPLNIYDAINFSKNAWNSVSQQTIFNCWKHTGILSQDEMDGEIEDDNQVFHDEIHNKMEI